jgi:hypothetical protein
VSGQEREALKAVERELAGGKRITRHRVEGVLRRVRAALATRGEPQRREKDLQEALDQAVEMVNDFAAELAAREESNAELIRQAERTDEVYGRRSQMEVYRLHPATDETEGFACWSGPVILDADAPDLLCVSYAQFSEALDVLRGCAGQSQAADDFVFRMDVNHVRFAAREDTERPETGILTEVEQLDTAGLVRVQLSLDDPDHLLSPGTARDLGRRLLAAGMDLAGEDTERPDARAGRFQEALRRVIRNDLTTRYSYATELGRSENAVGEFPPAGQRWLTPREIAEDALRDTEQEPKP